MSKIVAITFTCDCCGETAPRDEAVRSWLFMIIASHRSDGSDGIRADACSRKCARRLLIKACNTELQDDAG